MRLPRSGRLWGGDPGRGWPRSRLRRYFEPRLPGVACEISRDFFSVVQLDPHRSRWVDSFGVGAIPAGLVVPSLTTPAVASVEDLGKIIEATLFKAGITSKRISLVIPDSCTRVAIHPFEVLPSKQEEKTELLKWKLKKTIPYDIDDARLIFVEQPRESGPNYVITVSIHGEVLTQLESIFEALGIHVGFITLATFATYELLVRQDPDETRKSVLFMRVRPSDVSSVIVRDEAIVFYRHTGLDVEEPVFSGDDDLDGSPGRLVDPYEQIHPCLMYYQDKLGATGVDQVCLMYPRPFAEEELSSLAQRSRAPVSNFDGSEAFHWKQGPPSSRFRQVLSPALGLALGKH